MATEGGVTPYASSSSDILYLKIQFFRGKCETIKVPSSDTSVGWTKLEIEKCFRDRSLEASRQTLLYQGRVLKDYRKLSYYGIVESGSTIHLVMAGNSDEDKDDNHNIETKPGPSIRLEHEHRTKRRQHPWKTNKSRQIQGRESSEKIVSCPDTVGDELKDQQGSVRTLMSENKVEDEPKTLSNNPIAELRSWLEKAELRSWLRKIDSGEEGPSMEEEEFFSEPLLSREARAAKELLWSAHKNHIRKERQGELRKKVIMMEYGSFRMPFWYAIYGGKSEFGERSLWISLHGGGWGPGWTNTAQWEDQKRLYQPEEGIYLTPRAPTNTLDLWRAHHIENLLDRLIETMIVLEDVDPNRVYLMGSDGVSQLASTMTDRWASVAVMGGSDHPKAVSPECFRNTSFVVGNGEESPVAARSWKSRLSILRDADPEGYDHKVGNSSDETILRWMSKRTRNPHPQKILLPLWNHSDNDSDKLHLRSYWVAIDGPLQQIKNGFLIAELKGQVVRISITTEPSMIIRSGDRDSPVILRIRLNGKMLELDRPVIVMHNETEVFRDIPSRTIGTIARTLHERGDPVGIYSSEIVLQLCC